MLYKVNIAESWGNGSWVGTSHLLDYVTGAASAQEAVDKAIEFAKKQDMLNAIVTSVTNQQTNQVYAEKD